MSDELSVGREHRLRWTVPAGPRPGLPTRKGATTNGWLASDDPSLLRSAALRRSWPDQAVFQVSIADGPEPNPPLVTVTCRLAQIETWNPALDSLPRPAEIPVGPDPVKAGTALLRSLRQAIDACVDAGALGRIAGEGLLIAARDELERVRDQPGDRRS